MQQLWEVLGEEFAGFANFKPAVQLIYRLLMATFLGGLLGFERQYRGKQAGLRTHMLVALGTCLFIVATRAVTDIDRIVAGVITGVGFLGAGAIYKLQERKEIEGLTTAAGIWLAAAVGTAVAVGQTPAAIVGTILGLIVLEALMRLEQSLHFQN